MAKIPEFRSEEEEREFWGAHDSTEYWEDTSEVEPFELSPELQQKQRKRHLTIRIGQQEIDQAKAIAREKGLGYQTLMRMWILEGIKRERQEQSTVRPVNS